MAQASGAVALNVLGSPLLWGNRRFIIDRTAALHLPAIYQWPEMAEEGGFAAYGPRVIQLIREFTGRQLVQLFGGTKPADLPVEQPTKFALWINLKTAKAFGLTVPESLLISCRQGDRIISLFAAVNESLPGPKRTCRPVKQMSDVGGQADTQKLEPSLLLMTHQRHRLCIAANIVYPAHATTKSTSGRTTYLDSLVKLV